MSRFFELAKERYESGDWNKAMLRTLVKKKRITAAEYEAITGEAYA